MNIILPEIVSTGIYDSNSAEKNKIITNNRRVSMFEIELPIENGGITYIDSEKIRLTPNIVICAKPGQMRHTKLPFKCYYIHLIITEGDLFSTLMSFPNYLDTYKYPKYYEIFENLHNYYNTAINIDEFILQSLVLKLVHTLLNDSKRQMIKEQMKTNNYDVIKKITTYIKNNLTDNLNLGLLSTLAGFTPTYFHKLFKASTGKTVRDYIEEQRIKKALNLLLETDLTVTKIAYECGFSSQSYFNYVFKRKMKKSPKQYIKEFYEQYTKSF